jgi:hypothetical protein
MHLYNDGRIVISLVCFADVFYCNGCEPVLCTGYTHCLCVHTVKPVSRTLANMRRKVFQAVYVYQMRYLQMCISLFRLVFILLLQVRMNE